MAQFAAAGSSWFLVPGPRYVSSRARPFLPGEVNDSGKNNISWFLGTFLLAKPEFFKGEQTIKSVKMMFFNSAHRCCITAISWNTSSEHETPTEPKFSSRLTVQGWPVQCHTHSVLPSSSSHQSTAVSTPSAHGFSKDTWNFPLNNTGAVLTLILLYFQFFHLCYSTVEIHAQKPHLNGARRLEERSPMHMSLSAHYWPQQRVVTVSHYPSRRKKRLLLAQEQLS